MLIVHKFVNLTVIYRHRSSQSDGNLITGMVGPDDGGMTVEAANEAARVCGLNILATLKSELGDLDRVEQIVKVCK